MIDYDSLFYFVDEFSKAFNNWWSKSLLSSSTKRRNRATRLHLSEIITIMIAYHDSGYRCFKDYYNYVLFYHLREFPCLVSYERFVALTPKELIKKFNQLLNKRLKAERRVGCNYVISSQDYDQQFEEILKLAPKRTRKSCV